MKIRWLGNIEMMSDHDQYSLDRNVLFNQYKLELANVYACSRNNNMIITCPLLL